MSTTVRDVMTLSPAAVALDETALDAARRLASEDVGSLPVVEGAGVVGMVTDRDLVIEVLAKDVDPHLVKVSEICSKQPVTIAPDDALDLALQRMAEAQVRRLPVVEGGRLVGIVAQADVARSARPESTGRLVGAISESE